MRYNCCIGRSKVSDTSILNAEMPWPSCSLKYAPSPSGDVTIQNKEKSSSSWSGDDSFSDEDESINFGWLWYNRGYKRHKGDTIEIREKKKL